MLRTLLAGLLIAITSAHAQDVAKLDKMLDERIELNKYYKTKFVKETKGMTWETKLKPVEEAVGQEWVDFLIHVRQSKDLKLKVHVLKIEILDELRGSYYDLEYAETPTEFANGRAHLVKWKKKHEELNAVLAAGKKATEEPTRRP